jgi:hypothetical protein
MRLKVDVYFEGDDVDFMIDGLKVLVNSALEKCKERNEPVTMLIPVGTISVLSEENPDGE